MYGYMCLLASVMAKISLSLSPSLSLCVCALGQCLFLVINGCSELFRDVFGEAAGVGSRSAVGVSSLPLGVPTEVEGIFELTDQ